MKKQLGITLALSLGLLASHAAMANDAVLGALVGGGAGVLVGRSVGGRDGALIGGALGAAAGAVIASQHNRPRRLWAPSLRCVLCTAGVLPGAGLLRASGILRAAGVLPAAGPLRARRP